MNKINTLIGALKKSKLESTEVFVRKLASSDKELLKKKLEESGLSVDEQGVTLTVPLDLVLRLVSESSESPGVRRLLKSILKESISEENGDE